jgi:hypothetical protein
MVLMYCGSHSWGVAFLATRVVLCRPPGRCVVNDSHSGELAHVARSCVKGSIVLVVVDDSELCV